MAGKVDGFTGSYDPVAYAHVVTTTTHKTLRGPRGGMVLSTEEFGEYVDKGCPMVLGGPMPHVMAAKAVAFTEAATPEFGAYARAIVDNASALAATCIDNGMDILTGGTDNHLMLANVGAYGLTGRQAESAVREANVTLNRNSIPFDPNGAWYTSGPSPRNASADQPRHGDGGDGGNRVDHVLRPLRDQAPRHHEGKVRRTAEQGAQRDGCGSRRDRPRPRRRTSSPRSPSIPSSTWST